MAGRRNLEDRKNICDLSNSVRERLCRILNQDNGWKELVSGMELGPEDMKLLEKSPNPADTLLTLWGDQNHTIIELFELLQSIKHHRAMVQLQSSIPQIYRILIDEVRYKLQQQELRQKKANERKIRARTVNQSVLRSPRIPVVAAYIRIEEPLKIPSQPKLPGIPLEELAIITNQWSRKNILGRGGFGTVFSGTWNNTLVAIKKASYPHWVDPQRAHEYQVNSAKKEIDLLTSCRHENIVILYGFSCDVNKPPCLVYELMPNGSLSDRLCLRGGSRPLNWMERLKIAKGTARGLNYLHRYANRPLIHGDIKGGNILLDSSYEPKIGDFGLAREGPEIGSMIKLNNYFGTMSYQPDEFLHEYLFSTKIDTYSYGIVVLELATGLRSFEPGKGFIFLKDFVNFRYHIDLHSLQDIKAGVDNQNVFAKLMVLGRWCSNRLAKDRPEMDQVCQEFNYI